MTAHPVASELSGMSAPRGMLIPEMSGRASSPVLVGRAEQMAALEAAFVSVRQGGPSAVLLGGEAGVGKSRLVSDFGPDRGVGGARVLTGGCLELAPTGCRSHRSPRCCVTWCTRWAQTRWPRCCPAGPRGGWPGCCLSSVSQTPAVTRPRPGRGCSRRCSGRSST
jgi:Predicted ATPase